MGKDIAKTNAEGGSSGCQCLLKVAEEDHYFSSEKLVFPAYSVSCLTDDVYRASTSSLFEIVASTDLNQS